ncbi:MAG: MAE_28990/MAE_18760 family HEPN-like nuclease [Armatimonadetes bacterium]|nr:MAE_28990/MAE_18760 family HEPN-like nuclease [Armatimonadota bacterium]
MRKYLAFAELVRSSVAEHCSIQGADPGGAVVGPHLGTVVPDSAAWRVYDHCSAITRAYAMYEHCVAAYVDEWLAMLPDLYPAYSDLPARTRDSHMRGVGHILGRRQWRKYVHLSDQDVLGGLWGGLNRAGRYDVRREFFKTSDDNLRMQTLADMLLNVGIVEPVLVLTEHPSMVDFMLERLGNSETVESYLDGIVVLRNEAAHGDVANVLSRPQLGLVIDFLICFCEALGNCFFSAAVERMEDLGNVAVLGRVNHYYPDPDAVVASMRSCTVSTGDDLIARRGNRCTPVRVMSLELNDEPVTLAALSDGAELGLQLEPRVTWSADLLRLKVDHETAGME